MAGYLYRMCPFILVLFISTFQSLNSHVVHLRAAPFIQKLSTEMPVTVSEVTLYIC